MKLTVLTATLLLCTSWCGEGLKLLPSQQTMVQTSAEIEKVLMEPYEAFPIAWEAIYTDELLQDTLQLDHYLFAHSTTPEEKKCITTLLVNFKLGTLTVKVAEDGSSLVFSENWKEQFLFFPNIEYWFDEMNRPVMISKIADANRDEFIIALSLEKVKNAHIDHCLYDWYTDSENYLTQLPQYTARDIENLLFALRWWHSVMYKQ